VLAATLLRAAGAASARPQPASSIERRVSTDREPFGCRRRGRAAKELVCHLGKNWQAVLLIILSFPPGQHIQVSVFLDRQREVLIKLI